MKLNNYFEFIFFIVMLFLIVCLNGGYNLIVKPALIQAGTVDIPEELLQFSGNVLLQARVEPDSTLSNITIVKSSPRIDSLAIEIARSTNMSPQFENDIAIISSVYLRVDFYMGEYDVSIDDDFEKSLSDLKSEIELHTLNRNQVYEPFTVLNRRVLNLQYPVLQKNNSYISPFFFNKLKRKNNFFIFDYVSTTYNNFSSGSTFYNIQASNHSVFLTPNIYLYPVTFTELYLGLGSKNSSYAQLDIVKNHFLNIKNLGVKINFEHSESRWMETKEKLDSFRTRVYYTFMGGFINVEYEQYENQLSRENFKNLQYFSDEEFEIAKESSQEVNFIYENNMFYTGLRYENSEYSPNFYHQTYQRVLAQSVVGLRNKNEETLNYEVQWTASLHKKDDLDTLGKNFFNSCDYLFTSISYKNNFFRIQNRNFTGNNYRFHTKNSFTAFITEKYNVSINLIKNYFNENEKIFENSLLQEISLSFDLYSKYIHLKSSLGVRDYHFYFDSNSDNFLFFKNYFEFYYPMNYFSILTRNSSLLFYSNDENKILPTISNVFNQNIMLNLEHRNSIKFGVSHHYLSDYTKGKSLINPTNYYSAYINIGITDLFDIQFNIYNLTDVSNLYHFPVKSTSYDLRLKWFFVN